MIFIILTIVLFLLLIASMYNVIEAIKIKAYSLASVSAALAGLIGILLGLVLSGNLFTI